MVGLGGRGREEHPWGREWAPASERLLGAMVSAQPKENAGAGTEQRKLSKNAAWPL